MQKFTNFKKYGLLLLAIPLFSSCEIATHPNLSIHGIDGVWQTEGYGYLFDIKGEEVTIYETTRASCLKSNLIAGPMAADSDSGTMYKFPVSVPEAINSTMLVTNADYDDEKFFRRADITATMRVKKLDALPSECRLDTEGGAGYVARVFAQNFSEHYPFFVQKSVDWDSQTNILISNINNAESATDEALFENLVSAIRQLKDSHVALIAPSIDKQYFGDEREDPAAASAKRELRDSVIENNYLTSDIIYYCDDQLGFSLLENSIGYLKIYSLSQCSMELDFESAAPILQSAIEELFDQYKDLQGLVIDLRSDGGGSDAQSLRIAGALTNEKYLAYSKQATSNYSQTGDWTRSTEYFVVPNDRFSYTGEVVLLTDFDTISSAEVFAMSLIGREPKVTRIGSNTRGIFSEIMPRTLPNNWLLGLPNERYFDPEGQSYEGVGLPPDVYIAEADEFLESAKDIALDMAISILASE